MKTPDTPATDKPKRGRPAGDTPPLSNKLRTQRARRKAEEAASRIAELDPASVTDTVLLKALAVRLARLRKPDSENHDGARYVAAHIVKVLTDRYRLDQTDLA